MLILFDAINLTLIAIVFIYLFLIGLISRNGDKTTATTSYQAVIVTIALWAVAMILYRSSAPSTALFWTRVLYVSATLTASSFYGFSIIFPYSEKLSSLKLWSVVFCNIAIIALVLAPHLIIRNTLAIPYNEKVIIWGKYYFLYFIYIAGFFSIGLFNLYEKYKKAQGLTKGQIYYVFVGYLIGSNLAMFTNLILVWVGNFRYNWLGQVMSVFMAIFTVYAIINYRLMDIRLVARKYLVISAYIATVGAFFVLTKFLAVIYIENVYTDLLDLSLLTIAILFTSPIKKYYYRLANKYFFSSLYDSNQLIAEISDGLRSTINLDKIFELVDLSLKKNLHLKAFGVLLYSHTAKSYTVAFNSGFPVAKKIPFASDRYIHKKYIKQNLPVLVDVLKKEKNEKIQKTINLFDKFKIKVLIPLNIKNETIGLLVLGEKESEEIFNDEDFKALKVIASQAAFAIDNALLYDEVSQFNETLQSKVDEQTKDIQAKAEHLKKLMDMRSEFLDITSHQLRTPVSVIKGVLSMLEENSIPQARVKEFIKGAMEKAIKLGEIINDILRASEMDSDKFTMNLRPVDLNEMMIKIIEDKRRTAEMKKISMAYDIPKHIPLVMTDPKYVEHAIVNLINNALQYTVKGSIKTSIQVLPTHVVIRVTDTGIGIPAEALPKLFQKFSRAENAVTTFTDGTGLGLFIIKQIVDANPGARVEVERTQVGKGTTFALWLPVAEPVAAKIPQAVPAK